MKRLVVIDTNVILSALQSKRGVKMTTLSLRLPDSYHAMVKEITAKEEISINQFIISAVAEKISALETQNYLEERAERGSRNKFMAVLSKVPDKEPADYDR